MKYAVMVLLMIFALSSHVHAADFTAPSAPEDVQELMPHEKTTFAEGLAHVLKSGLQAAYPSIRQCFSLCIRIALVGFFVSALRYIPAGVEKSVDLAGSVAVACILMESTNVLITQASQTVTELSQYGKLLLPVMAGAMAAQGSGSAASALYLGTTFLNTILGTLIPSLLIPLIYVYLALSVATAAVESQLLSMIKKTIHTATSKGLRIILYIFTGYLTVSGVVGGATDQMALKAVKLTISSAIPVVGNIMADASETVLISAGIAKSVAGVYGLWCLIAIGIGPFLQTASQHLILKATGAVCSAYAGKQVSGIIHDFSSALGLLLAMIGAVSILNMISTICFMKGFA